MEILWFKPANEELKQARTEDEVSEILNNVFKIEVAKSICPKCKYSKDCVAKLRFCNPIVSCHFYRGGE